MKNRLTAPDHSSPCPALERLEAKMDDLTQMAGEVERLKEDRKRFQDQGVEMRDALKRIEVIMTVMQERQKEMSESIARQDERHRTLDKRVAVLAFAASGIGMVASHFLTRIMG
ncbi:MAG: hypothetical protein HQM03_15055 [Magnetococcales bacterium]|nr:hypothetical protein [Magnetococcales bacterium]